MLHQISLGALFYVVYDCSWRVSMNDMQTAYVRMAVSYDRYVRYMRVKICLYSLLDSGPWHLARFRILDIWLNFFLWLDSSRFCEACLRPLDSRILRNWQDNHFKRKDDIKIFAWLLIAVISSILQHGCSQLSITKGIQRNFHFSEVVLASF